MGVAVYGLLELARRRGWAEFAARPPGTAAEALLFAQTPVMGPSFAPLDFGPRFGSFDNLNRL